MLNGIEKLRIKAANNTNGNDMRSAVEILENLNLSTRQWRKKRQPLDLFLANWFEDLNTALPTVERAHSAIAVAVLTSSDLLRNYIV